MPMDSSWTRRWFLRSVAGGMASAGVASAQRDSPAGDIRVQGQRATFSIDGGRFARIGRLYIHSSVWLARHLRGSAERVPGRLG